MVDQPTATLVAAGAALIVGLAGSGVALIIGWRQGSASKLAAKAALTSAEATQFVAVAAGNRTIASMRLQWLEDLRKLLAEYHSILTSYEDASLPPGDKVAAALRDAAVGVATRRVLDHLCR